MSLLQPAGRPLRLMLLAAALAVVLSGCIYDARAPYARFVNHLETPVTIEITGSEEDILELGPGQERFLGEDPGCLGDGLVVSSEGLELAVYDGPICTDTNVNVWNDERGLTVSTSEDDRVSVPLSTEPD